MKNSNVKICYIISLCGYNKFYMASILLCFGAKNRFQIKDRFDVRVLMIRRYKVLRNSTCNWIRKASARGDLSRGGAAYCDAMLISGYVISINRHRLAVVRRVPVGMLEVTTGMREENRLREGLPMGHYGNYRWLEPSSFRISPTRVYTQTMTAKICTFTAQLPRGTFTRYIR